jgi:hypothetical protein
MKPQPNPERFKRKELQEAYELGFSRECEHDSLVLLERFGWLLDEAATSALGAERIAAMLDGAADALRELARRRRESLPALRAIDNAGI